MLNKKIIKKFNLEGNEAIFRYPKPEDWKDFLNVINSLIEERAMISAQKKKTKKEEIEWLASLLKKIKNKKSVFLVVEINGKIKGSAGITMGEKDITDHIGEFGIVLLKEIRGKRVGKKLLKEIVREAKEKLKIKIIKLQVMGPNITAQDLYKECGFKEVGRIKKGFKYYGKYIDNIIMTKYI